MKLEVNFTKKKVIPFVALLVIVAGLIYVYAATPNPGHDSNGISVMINSVEKTLQQAIDDGDFSAGSAGTFSCINVSATVCEDTYWDQGFYRTGGLCCTGDGNYVYRNVLMGWDNNGNSFPDCWVISGDRVGSCPGGRDIYRFALDPDTKDECAYQAARMFNNLTIEGHNDWEMVYWWDNGGTSDLCVDASSDALQVSLRRPA